MSGAAQQVGDQDSLQQTGHHQTQAQGQEHIWDNNIVLLLNVWD